MKENHIDELIDAYLKRRITANEHEELAHLTASDPEIKESVRESEDAYAYLKFARAIQIKKRLQEFDSVQDQRKLRVSKHLKRVAALLFLAVLAVTWFWWAWYCKPENIARRNFEWMIGTEGIGAEQTEVQQSGTEYFMNGDFENAARLFQSMAELHPGEAGSKARWNVLMSHLAMFGYNDILKTQLMEFSTSYPAYKMKAEKLISFLGSAFYIPGGKKSRSGLHGWRPRLI